MKATTKRLVRLAARFVNRRRGHRGAGARRFEDMDAFSAPSECGDLVNRSYDREIAREAARLGFAPEVLWAVVDRYQVKTDGPLVHGFAPEYFAGRFDEQEVRL